MGKAVKPKRESSKGKGKGKTNQSKGKKKPTWDHTRAPLWKGHSDDRDDQDDTCDDSSHRSWNQTWNSRWHTNDGSGSTQRSQASKWDKGADHKQRSSNFALICHLCLTCHWLLGFNLDCPECTGASGEKYFDELVAAGCKVRPDHASPLPAMECPFGDPLCHNFLGFGECAVCSHLQTLWLRFARHFNDPPLDFYQSAMKLAFEKRLHAVLNWEKDKSFWSHICSLD